MKALTTLLALTTALAAAGLAHGREAPEQVARPDVWRHAWGTDEVCPFRLVDGVANEGRFDEVASRADWVVEHEGRTYLLYEVNPGKLDDTIYVGIPDEKLWIGLVGDDGEIQRKILLARGVHAISGVRREASGEAYVEAADKEGTVRRIPLQFPEPWPELAAEGGEWARLCARMSRLSERLWEDWPGDGSGYATEHVWACHEEATEQECGRAVERLRTVGIPEALREDLAGEPERTLARAREKVGDSSLESGSAHWANAMDAATRAEYITPHLRNWFEGVDHPEAWTRVYRAEGEFRGIAFRATNGVAVLEFPEWKQSFSKEPPWGLIRLAPEQVREENGRTLVGFRLTIPENVSSTCLGGTGTFAADADGVLREVAWEEDVRESSGD